MKSCKEKLSYVYETIICIKILVFLLATLPLHYENLSCLTLQVISNK